MPNMEGSMRYVLQHSQNRWFKTAAGSWTPDLGQAMVFTDAAPLPPEFRWRVLAPVSLFNPTGIDVAQGVLVGLLKVLHKGGWRVERVDNGDGWVSTETDAAVFEECLAVDEWFLLVTNGRYQHIIRGVNERYPCDVIVDWSHLDDDESGLCAILDPYTRSLEGS